MLYKNLVALLRDIKLLGCRKYSQHVENIPWYRFYKEESIQYIFFYINNTSSILFRSFYDDFTKKDFYASLKKSLFS